MKIWYFLVFLIPFGFFCEYDGNTRPTSPVVQSSVTFKIANAEIVANGRFEQMETQIEFDPEHIEKTQFHCAIEVESIKTGIRLRDQHLKKPVYFHVDLFPKIMVDLKKIEVIGSGKLSGFFAVSMKGISQNITIPIEWKKENGLYRFDAEFDINRRDFKVGGKSWTLSDIARVKVSFSVKA